MKNDARLLISLNNACQYNCGFCIYLHKKHRTSITTAQWLSAIKSAREHGFSILEIGGQGEPTLHKDFCKIVTRAYEFGYKIELLSNGQNYPAILKVLPKIDLFKLNLNGTCEKEFKEIHKTKIEFKDCIKNISYLLNGLNSKNREAKVCINYIITNKTFSKSILFPKKINAIFRKHVKNFKPIYTLFHHMLICPNNNRLLPNIKILESMLFLFKKAKNEFFISKYSNCEDFILLTERLIKQIKILQPLDKNTLQNNKNYLQIKKFSEIFTCGCSSRVLFIDYNGDTFNCFNPSRIIHGLVPYHKDPFYCGNLIKNTLSKIINKANCRKYSLDFSKRHWKSCLICGVKINNGNLQ